MAQISINWQLAFKNMGLDFSKLQEKGFTIVINASGLKFGMSGESHASLPIPPGKLSEIATGFDPKNTNHATVKASLQNVIAQLEKKFLGPKIGGDAVNITGVGGHVTSASTVAAVAPVSVDGVPLDKMKTMTPIKLAEASKLFQPVKGTTAGSKYFVVGMGDGIRVAARCKNNKLSVRIEGKNFSKLAMKIQEAGVFGPAFAGSYNSDYASMHLAVDGKKEAQRVIGAVLGSLAPFISHPVPDIQPLMVAA